MADAASGQLRVLHVVCAQIHPHPARHHRHRLFGGYPDGTLCRSAEEKKTFMVISIVSTLTVLVIFRFGDFFEETVGFT